MSKLAATVPNDTPTPTPSLHIQLHVSRPPTSFVAVADSLDIVAPSFSVLQFHSRRKATLRSVCLYLSHSLSGPKISFPSLAVHDRLFSFLTHLPPPLSLSLPFFSSEGEHQLFSSLSAFLHFPSASIPQARDSRHIVLRIDQDHTG